MLCAFERTAHNCGYFITCMNMCMYMSISEKGDCAFEQKNSASARTEREDVKSSSFFLFSLSLTVMPASTPHSPNPLPSPGQFPTPFQTMAMLMYMQTSDWVKSHVPLRRSIYHNYHHQHNAICGSTSRVKS